MTVFWFLLYAQKERPGGEPYRLCTLHILRDADRRPQIWLKNSFASFCRSKRKAPAASGANYAFAKGSTTPTGDYKFGLKFLLLLFMGEKQALPAGGFYSAGKAARRQVRETSER